MSRLGIVDYQAGNLASVRHAVIAAAGSGGAGVEIDLVDKAEDICKCDRIILPGVGTFGGCAGQLRQQGLFGAIEEFASGGKPLLGICVGMQLMARRGLERGAHEGFGWFDGVVDRLDERGSPPRLPHMGWNTPLWTKAAASHPVTAGIPRDEAVYFVHSFAFDRVSEAHLLAEADYGGRFVAAIARDNLIGVQFHPEKSQRVGLALIAGFLNWKP